MALVRRSWKPYFAACIRPLVGKKTPTGMLVSAAVLPAAAGLGDFAVHVEFRNGSAGRPGHFDDVFIRGGRAVALMSVAAVGDRFPAALERALVAKVAARLGR